MLGRRDSIEPNASASPPTPGASCGQYSLLLRTRNLPSANQRRRATVSQTLAGFSGVDLDQARIRLSDKNTQHYSRSLLRLFGTER
jgi:hypothetical protein